MGKIITISLEAKNLKELAKKIQDFQNSNNLVSQGSLPFSLKEGVGVIMFFPKGETPINFEKVAEQKPCSNEAKSPKASQKQIDLLYKLNADFNAEKITKKEANILIKKELAKKNE